MRVCENAWDNEPREVHNHTMDSTRWYDFCFRAGDVVVVTWAKAGTTWVQQIVSQLIFEGRECIPILDISPWIEHRCYPKKEILGQLEAQTHRRFVKSHLPADALVYCRYAKYIYVGRDGRDVIWSWYQHHKNLTQPIYDFLNNTPGRVGPPLAPPASTFRACFHGWLDHDGAPLWPFWSHVASWWELRDRPNVLLVHFSDLKADLLRETHRIANFLEIPVRPETWQRISEHCSFEYMKSHVSTFSQHLDSVFVEGAKALINHGKNRKWRDALSAPDLAKYRYAMAANVTSECAHWLRTGET